ncbi:deoxyribodipyrimidine photolyase [Aliigemmobacter aestuarii]|uniref:Deoxyribodipyrimidine photolyase n=1 Tax=Aliigemmobacter aestuarii TaxID=1445661 RepID=A0A4S3MK81_9RHOB|nr:FAD-binding domain-containing protein [Gemmobacter aestuarii]THD82225.1 deoxyribodipyrimidine photolyase [Gemmobacter aestuarii]
MNVLLWLKRDLRLTDHPALTLASGLGPVLPLYVVEPEYWTGADASARQWAFTAETLAALRADFAALGVPLVVRVGDAVEVIARLARTHSIGQIVSHEETGTLWTFARDRRMAAWARQAGIEWTELPQTGVVRRLKDRTGWAARRDAFMAEPPLPVPNLSPVEGVEPGPIPDTRALRLAHDPCPHRQGGGRALALTTLEGFLNQRATGYRSGMSSPLTAERGCSRLSPHLAIGAISAREVETALRDRMAQKPGPGWAANLNSFASRLAWRDHFTQKLEDAPDMERRALHRAADRLRVSDATRLEAFRTGETGLPFVDACLRYLAATGWINFRMRAMLTSVGCYQFWLDWRDVGGHLAHRFTDYDPGIHWPQVQMQAGVTGINRLRIYNPVKQGLDQDPAGAFTRRWLPELAEVPDAFLHSPWKWSGAGRILGRRYPEPVVDPAAAARAARQALADLRRAPGFAEAAGAILSRHASPKDRPARFVNDRAPARPRPAPPGQLSLEL